MKNKAHDLSNYSFCGDDTILLDTNVWIYLYPAPSKANRWLAIQYSKGLKAILSAGAQLVVDAVVLSEYLNTYCRIEWSACHKCRYPQFKTFRKSAEFVAVAKGAAIFARSMLQLAKRHDYPFAKINVNGVLADFEAGSFDFNDGLLVETCRHNGWKLVTHDADFTSGGIEVLTKNQHLIVACQ